MSHSERQAGPRLLVGLGCLMVVGVPLAVIASCTFRGSSHAPQRPVHHTVTPAATVYVPLPQGRSYGSVRRTPSPAAARPSARKTLAPVAPAVRPAARPGVRVAAPPARRPSGH